MRLLKCYGPKCYKQGIKHPRENLITFKNKNYCSDCLAIVKSSHERYEHLLNFIIENFHVPFPSPKMLSQIKQFLITKHYTYQGIETALIYMHTIKHKDFDEKFGLGYIPYIYNEAQSWQVSQSISKNIIPTNIDNLPATATMHLKQKTSTVGLISEEGLLD